VKTSLGAPHTFLFPGSELVSCDTVKSFAAQAKIVRSTSENRSQLNRPQISDTAT
jgi:hypothetical protein